jgi:choline dehydrogenase-like flavoprotein
MLSIRDFEANSKDGNGVDWPIRYDDLKEWYDYVEGYVGISGSSDSLPHLPGWFFANTYECCRKSLKRKHKQRIFR